MDRNEIGAKARQRQDQREERASEERKRMQDRNEEQRNEGGSEEEGEGKEHRQPSPNMDTARKDEESMCKGEV
jgi:hypothetical protein